MNDIHDTLVHTIRTSLLIGLVYWPQAEDEILGLSALYLALPYELAPDSAHTAKQCCSVLDSETRRDETSQER